DSPYDITYTPRNAIKGQVIVDFLADTVAGENTPNKGAPNSNVVPDPKEAPESSKGKKGSNNSGPHDQSSCMEVYTYRASNDHGFGASLIFIHPEGVEYSYALRLNFSNSNNDAKYEALLAGLIIETGMKVKKMQAFVDSKLVASQVKGSYETRWERTKKYKEKVLEIVRRAQRAFGGYGRIKCDSKGGRKNVEDSKQELLRKRPAACKLCNQGSTYGLLWNVRWTKKGSAQDNECNVLLAKYASRREQRDKKL
nr:hypothetical protein [Tanacetum cinerariifolium]